MRKIKMLVLAMIMLAAVGLSNPLPALAAGDILCSTFPVYLFTKNIIRGSGTFKASLMIENANGCPHGYVPTASDLERLSRADVLIINGLGLEEFLPRALRTAKDDLKIIDASAGSGTITSADDSKSVIIDRRSVMSAPQLIDGPNPHLFASPSTAKIMVNNIADGLATLDPENAKLYQVNANSLIDSLDMIFNNLQVTGQTLGRPKVMASHSVFEFLAHDMGLDIVALIAEVDGAEASSARISTLAQQARKQMVKAIIVDPGNDVNTARILGAEANIPVVVIDPVSFGPLGAPFDYYQKVMLTNAMVLVDLFVSP